MLLSIFLRSLFGFIFTFLSIRPECGHLLAVAPTLEISLFQLFFQAQNRVFPWMI